MKIRKKVANSQYSVALIKNEVHRVRYKRVSDFVLQWVQTK